MFGKANQLSRADLQPDSAQRRALSDELVPAPARLVTAGRSPEAAREISAPVARQLAWLAFWDIAVFFAILLVGFAYLWKRGDLDWVRSTLAERQVATKVVSLPTNEQGELVGAGQG
ncbi:MAG TPA: NADH-quinone oxidoreductase subunit A [Gemmataceae bacterium]|nr:NADH-quinone oxidoreductase subunit A [Gemmataceae bacterium]